MGCSCAKFDKNHRSGRVQNDRPSPLVATTGLVDARNPDRASVATYIADDDRECRQLLLFKDEELPRQKMKNVGCGGGGRVNYHIALALLNANRAASLVVHDMCPGHLEQSAADQLIRKAKNDGKTVSVVNGCLYLDYKFTGFLPMVHV